MSNLNDLTNVEIEGVLTGAYDEGFKIKGLDRPVAHTQLLQYILDNLGGGGNGGGPDSFVNQANLDGNNNLVLTLNDGSTVQTDLSTLENTDEDDFVVGANLDGANNLVLTMDSGATVSVSLNSLVGGGGGLLQYAAIAVNTGVDEGAFVTATQGACTYERVGGAGQNTEGIITPLAGTILRGLSVHFSAGQAPGNTFYLNIDYQNSNRPVNGSQDTVMPLFATVASKPAAFSDGTPATNYVHAGTPLQIGIAQVDDNGTRTRVRYKISNYSQQVGSNASILSLIFP